MMFRMESLRRISSLSRFDKNPQPPYLLGPQHFHHGDAIIVRHQVLELVNGVSNKLRD